MKEKTLGELRTYRFQKSDTFSLTQLQDLLSGGFDQVGCKCVFSTDVVRTDGLFKENPSCLVISSAEHGTDYFNFVCYMQAQKKYNLLYVKVGGKSRQAKYDVFAKNVKVFDGGIRKGIATGFMAGGSTGAAFAIGSIVGGSVRGAAKLIGKGLNALMRDKEAYEEELSYYYAVISAIDYSLSAN